MATNKISSTAHLPQITASESPSTSSQGLAPQSFFQKLTRDARRIKSTVGFAGLLALFVGMMLAVVCAAWCVQSGLAYPLAIAVGYLMLVCTICLSAALAVLLNSADKAVQTDPRSEPNYDAWNVVTRLRVSDASRLWCDIEPGCAASQESLAWAQAIFNAIRNGELPVCVRPGASKETVDRERTHPNWATEVDRDELKTWARAHGHSPRFLNT